MGKGGDIHCDDCTLWCRSGCARVSADEQPYFQAYRLATRRLPGEPWDTWEYMQWNRRQWAAFRAEHGIIQDHQLQHADEFCAWLFARVGHPEAQHG